MASLTPDETLHSNLNSRSSRSSFDFNNLSVRRALREDATDIDDILLEESRSKSADGSIQSKASHLAMQFGRTSVPYLIESSMLSLVAYSHQDASQSKITHGFASFSDELPEQLQMDYAENEHICLSPLVWQNTLANIFSIPQDLLVHPHTAYITFFVMSHSIDDDDLSCNFIEAILNQAFMEMPTIQRILLFFPREAAVYSSFKRFFQPISASDNSTKACLYQCVRSNLFPLMSVRMATIEDHDSLAPLFNEQSELLVETYGQFFLASIIENQTDHDKSLVAEVNSHVVGLLSLSDQLDLSLLSLCFELDKFDNFAKSSLQSIETNHPSNVHFEALYNSLMQMSLNSNDIDRPSVINILRSYLTDHFNIDAAVTDLSSVLSGFDIPISSISSFIAALNQIVTSVPQCDLYELCSHIRKTLLDSSSVAMDASDNVFAITLFCMHKSFRERAFEFLSSAFDLFPSRDWCIITMPHAVSEFPLLSSFTQVEPTPSNTFGHVLYVLHRNSLYYGPLSRVRWAEQSDFESIEFLFENEDEESSLQKLFRRAKNSILPLCPISLLTNLEAIELLWNLPFALFTIECQGSVVGTVILEAIDGDGVEHLRSNFDLDIIFDTNAYTGIGECLSLPAHHAVVRFFTVNPVFENMIPFLLRQSMRLYRKTVLHYFVDSDRHLPFMYQLGCYFSQIRPIRSPVAWTTKKRADVPLAAHSLHSFSKRLSILKKPAINHRIVIVGASEVALSLLESLVMLPDRRFTHICLISRGGLPTAIHSKTSLTICGDIADIERVSGFLPGSLHFDPLFLHQLALHVNVRIIDAALVDIDRGCQSITLDDGTKINYDKLILTTGLQDFTSNTLAAIDTTATQANNVIRSAAELRIAGVFNLSCEYQVYPIVEYIETRMSMPCNVIIYGSHLPALTALGKLLQFTDCAKLTWIYPAQYDDANIVFDDHYIWAKISNAIHHAGVTTVLHSRISAVQYSNGHIVSVAVDRVDDADTITIPCDLLICSECLDIDPHVHNAIMKNSLVLDGRLVIDSSFCTIDANVLAAGPLTKFSRSVSTALPMDAYDSRELGQHLAISLLLAISPLLTLPVRWSSGCLALSNDCLYSNTRKCESKISTKFLPPLGSLPKSCFARLIANMFLFRAATPYTVLKPNFKLQQVMTHTTNQFTRLGFDSLNVLQSIVTFGTTEVPVRNLHRLIGLPASYLNRLLPKYHDGHIDDIMAHLTSGWANALYHERFRDLTLSTLNDLVTAKAQYGTLLQKAIKAQQSSTTHEISALTRDLSPRLTINVQQTILRFIEQHLRDLPVYNKEFV